MRTFEQFTEWAEQAIEEAVYDGWQLANLDGDIKSKSGSLIHLLYVSAGGRSLFANALIPKKQGIEEIERVLHLHPMYQLLINMVFVTNVKPHHIDPKVYSFMAGNDKLYHLANDAPKYAAWAWRMKIKYL